YAPGSGTAKRSAPSNTRSSSPAGTCSQPASSTARPAATTSSTATSKKPSTASSNNSKRSATTSHSNRSPLNQHRFSHQPPSKNDRSSSLADELGSRYMAELEHVGGDQVSLELRVPWAYLGFADPSSLRLLQPRRDGSMSTVRATRVGI